MPLPPVAFYSIYEISVRWGCPVADVAGWAAAGHLQVLAGIAPVMCGSEPMAGLVEVPIAELMPMFRRFGPSEEHCRLKRLRPADSKDWLTVTEPVDGVLIRASDLLLAAGPVRQFEEERDLLRRPAPSIGSGPRYDWDGLNLWLMATLFEDGLPESQTALVTMAQDWFVRNSGSGDIPEESTIRKKLAPLWRKLKGEERV